MNRQRDDQRHAQHRRPDQVRDAQVRHLRDEAARDRADQHRHAADHLGPAEDVLEVAREAGRLQRVDQPRLGGAGEEREAQAQQDRGDRPAPQRRVDLPHHQVQEGRHEQRGRAEHVRELPAARVGHDAGGHLEDHLADREEGVGRERLRVAQARVEQEDRVDAPDERRGQRRQERQDEIRALDRARGVSHGSRCHPTDRTTRTNRRQHVAPTGGVRGLSATGRRYPAPMDETRRAWLAERRARVVADYDDDAPTYDDEEYTGRGPGQVRPTARRDMPAGRCRAGRALRHRSLLRDRRGPPAGASSASTSPPGCSPSRNAAVSPTSSSTSASRSSRSTRPSMPRLTVDAMENVPPEDWPLVLRNLHRAVRPGGHLYLSVEEQPDSHIADGIRRAAAAGRTRRARRGRGG